MAELPKIFLTTATWAEGRSFGDPAGIAVRELLVELTGPPRIGVCSVDAPIQVTVAEALMVHTAWPAVGSGTDVVLLVHAGDLPGRVRSRMRAGPQKFVHVEDKEQAENYTIGIAELAAVRARLLDCELRALMVRFPQVGELISGVVEVQPRRPRVVVIGPEPAQVVSVRSELAPFFTMVDSADADVVVAVPGGNGFLLIDAPTIQDAWQRVGRLVTLSPLPAGVCPQAVPVGRDLVTTISRLAAQPAQITTPPVPGARWLQVLDRFDRDHREQIRCLRARGDRSGMRELARSRGRELPPEPRIQTRELLITAGLALGICLIKPDVVPVLVGILGFRIFQQRQRELAKWWEEAVRILSLDTTSGGRRGGAGPRAWTLERFREDEKL